MALAPLPLLIVMIGAAGPITLVAGSVLGLLFLGSAWRGYRDQAGPRWARGLFLFSLVHLTALFGVLAVDQVL